MKKIYDEVKGWGEIIAEGNGWIVVRWDRSPWYPEEIAVKG